MTDDDPRTVLRNHNHGMSAVAMKSRKSSIPKRAIRPQTR